jgi:hypothetical protein
MEPTTAYAAPEISRHRGLLAGDMCCPASTNKPMRQVRCIKHFNQAFC